MHPIVMAYERWLNLYKLSLFSPQANYHPEWTIQRKETWNFLADLGFVAHNGNRIKHIEDGVFG